MFATAIKPYARAASTDNTAWVGDSRATFLATGEDTDGAFGLVEFVAVRGHQPPPHVHAGEEECFYVLEGRLTLAVDGQELDAPAGTFAVVPRNTPHTFRVESERARMLVMVTPAGFERFFLELSTPVGSLDEAPPVGELDIPRLIATAEKYGCQFLPPAS